MIGIAPVAHTNQQDFYEDINAFSFENSIEEHMRMRAIAEQSNQIINKHIADTLAMAPPSPDFSCFTLPSITQALDEYNIQCFERDFQNTVVYPESVIAMSELLQVCRSLSEDAGVPHNQIITNPLRK